MKLYFAMMAIVGILFASTMTSQADDAHGKAPLSVVIYANGYQDVTVAIKRVLEKACEEPGRSRQVTGR
jgi:hypothetical protein